MPNSETQLRRVEIIDGFVMPGFKGRFFMWPEEYWLLSKYVDLTEGDYLEIGSMCGIIAMSFAEKYPQRQFVCVDKFSVGHSTAAGEKETFLQNQREHELRNVTLLEGDSLSVVPELSQGFDIIFVDANHAYDYVLGDAINSWQLLSPGGFMVFHDYTYVEETTRAVDEFLMQTGGCFLESASSLAVVQKPGGRQNDPAYPLRAGLRNHMQGKWESDKKSWEAGLMKLEFDNKELHDEMARLNDVAGRREQELARLNGEKQQLEAALRAVENSKGWRLLNIVRQTRDVVLFRPRRSR